MIESKLPVTAIFEELVRMGHLTPPAVMEEMRLPGQFLTVPSYTTYGIPDFPLSRGIYDDAKLGQRPQTDFGNRNNPK